MKKRAAAKKEPVTEDAPSHNFVNARHDVSGPNDPKWAYVAPVTEPSLVRQLSDSLDFRWQKLGENTSRKFSQLAWKKLDDKPHPWCTKHCHSCRGQGNFCRLHNWIPATRSNDLHLLKEQLLGCFHPFTEHYYEASGQPNVDPPVPEENGLSGYVLDDSAYADFQVKLNFWLQEWVRNLVYLNLAARKSRGYRKIWDTLDESSRRVFSHLNNQVFREAGHTAVTAYEHKFWGELTKEDNPVAYLTLLGLLLKQPVTFFRERGTLCASPAPFVMRNPLRSVLAASKRVQSSLMDRTPNVASEMSFYDSKLRRIGKTSVVLSEYLYEMPAGYYLAYDGSAAAYRAICALSMVEDSTIEMFGSGGVTIEFGGSAECARAEELYWASLSNLYELRQLWKKFMLAPHDSDETVWATSVDYHVASSYVFSLAKPFVSSLLDGPVPRSYEDG